MNIAFTINVAYYIKYVIIHNVRLRLYKKSNTLRSLISLITHYFALFAVTLFDTLIHDNYLL